MASRLDSPGLAPELNPNLPGAGGAGGAGVFLKSCENLLLFSMGTPLGVSLCPGPVLELRASAGDDGDDGVTVSGLFCPLLRPTLSPLISAGG